MSLRTFTSPATSESPAEQLKRALDRVSKAMIELNMYFFWYMYEHIPIYYREKRNPLSVFVGATDGVAVYLGDDFLKLSFHEKIFALLHEILHIAYDHPNTMKRKLRQARDPLERNVTEIVGNVVMDAVINRHLADLFNSRGIDTSFIKEKYVDPDKLSSLIGEDVGKLGYALANDRLLLMVRSGEVKVEATRADGQPIDLSKGSVRSLSGGLPIVVTFTNVKTGAQIKFLLNPDLVLSNRCRSGSDETEDDVEGDGAEGVGVSDGQGQGDARDTQVKPATTKHSMDEVQPEDQPSQGEGGGCKECNVGRHADAEAGRTGDKRGSRGARGTLVKKPIGGEMPTPETIPDIVRSAAMFERTMSEKSAGAGFSANYLYEVVNIEKRSASWFDRFRGHLMDYMGSFKYFSWSIVNRRMPGIKPGFVRLGTPHIIVMLDTSGSMLGGSLDKALSEIFAIVEHDQYAKVTLYQWSSTCTLPQRIDERFVRDVKRHKKIMINTGGTEIEPALDMVLGSVTKNDLVVIMSDGYIFDINKESVQMKLSELAKKSYKTLFVTVGVVPPLPDKIEVIRIED